MSSREPRGMAAGRVQAADRTPGRTHAHMPPLRPKVPLQLPLEAGQGSTHQRREGLLQHLPAAAVVRADAACAAAGPGEQPASVQASWLLSRGAAWVSAPGQPNQATISDMYAGTDLVVRSRTNPRGAQRLQQAHC